MVFYDAFYSLKFVQNTFMKYLLPVLFLASCVNNNNTQKIEIENRIDSLNIVLESNLKESAKLVEEIIEHKSEVIHLREEVNEHKESLANLKLSDEEIVEAIEHIEKDSLEMVLTNQHLIGDSLELVVLEKKIKSDSMLLVEYNNQLDNLK